MKLSRTAVVFIVLIMMLTTCVLQAATVNPSGMTKKLDLSKYHNVGNIWLRVSNYGFFGSGDANNPRWPSLEYPGGSGVDYLYQGALWFGAKKVRKNSAGAKYYWKNFPPQRAEDAILEFNTDGTPNPEWSPNFPVVIDTLVSVGFDGDKNLYEFLPAYNPLEFTTNGYNLYNNDDQIMSASTRNQKRGFDDDGDGSIDEDGPGYDFRLRPSSELPAPFASVGGFYLDQVPMELILRNINIWFPLGFTELADSIANFNFASEYDSDNDGLYDEDGAPVSEQDYISYYYDYSPFNTRGEHDYGSSSGSNTHIPLRIRVRQMSYQWSFEFIKNLAYIEFDVTNMNIADTLYDCAMGIYMDSDVGPQSFGDTERSEDDKSGYYRGKGYEFAYTFDADFDSGLSPGYVGSRVCTPDPDTLEFACWFWKVGDGPDDFTPTTYWSVGSRKTANQKYWLLTGKNPNPTKIESLRKDSTEFANPNYEQVEPADTRYLFAFYGAKPGTPEYDNLANRWNLPPKKTMKIVIALFPGDNIDELKESASWAKTVYGQAQNLITVTQPDTVSHYNPPEPPQFPLAYYELVDNGNNRTNVNVFWDNRSEYTVDYITVKDEQMGWNTRLGYNSNMTGVDMNTIPEQFRNIMNETAIINPFTAWRLRHDFQGYGLYTRSNSGSNEDWQLIKLWDKIDTAQDLIDYEVNSGLPGFVDFGGEIGRNFGGLPQKELVTNSNFAKYNGHYILDQNYFLKAIALNDTVYGTYFYNTKADSTLLREASHVSANNEYSLFQQEQLLFKKEGVRNDVFLTLVDDALITLAGHLGQSAIGTADVMASKRLDRLCRRYYTATVTGLKQGFENYISVTAWDRGMPSKNLKSLETGKDANMFVCFPGTISKPDGKNVYVIPNPYRGSSKFDGRREKDEKGDRSRRLWFVNLPEHSTIKIFTLAGDLVDQIEHNGAYEEDIITLSKAKAQGLTVNGIHSWNLLSKNNQIVAPGLYLFSVKDKSTGKITVGKFVIIR